MVNMLCATYALCFASAAHAAIGQKRKYTGEDYIAHPKAVANLLMDLLGDQATPEMISAALLHDVIEDTLVPPELVEEHFGSTIARMVWGLTNKATEEDGNRAERHRINVANLAVQPYETQTIKLCDVMDNIKNIAQHDPKFAKTYLAEKRVVVDALTLAHPKVRALAYERLEQAMKELQA